MWCFCLKLACFSLVLIQPPNGAPIYVAAMTKMVMFRAGTQRTTKNSSKRRKVKRIRRSCSSWLSEYYRVSLTLSIGSDTNRAPNVKCQQCQIVNNVKLSAMPNCQQCQIVKLSKCHDVNNVKLSKSQNVKISKLSTMWNCQPCIIVNLSKCQILKMSNCQM